MKLIRCHCDATFFDFVDFIDGRTKPPTVYKVCPYCLCLILRLTYVINQELKSIPKWVPMPPPIHDCTPKARRVIISRARKYIHRIPATMELTLPSEKAQTKQTSVPTEKDRVLRTIRTMAGVPVRCRKCGHAWTYKGTLSRRVECPGC